MRRLAIASVLLVVGAAAVPATSAVIRSLDVSKSRGRYELVAETHLAAPADAIFDVLVDYEDGAFGRISSVYKESDYLEPAPDGTPIVYTRMEGCLAFFCKSMRRVERLETDEPHYIRTLTLPDQSDFTYASSEWELTPVENGTEVTYRLVMEPDFWVPPLIGPYIMKRTLMRGGTRAINRIERLARGEPSGLGPAQRGEAGRSDSSGAEAGRSDSSGAEAARRDSAGAESARRDSSSTEAPRGE